MEYIRKHAVRLLRLREQHTPPRSVIIVVISSQLMHFLIHAHGGKLAIIQVFLYYFYWAQKLRKYTVSIIEIVSLSGLPRFDIWGYLKSKSTNPIVLPQNSNLLRNL